MESWVVDRKGQKEWEYERRVETRFTFGFSFGFRLGCMHGIESGGGAMGTS